MHDLAFADSARQAPVKILRLPMLPYSIGHELILLSQRNPLLFDVEFFNALTPAEQVSAIVRAALVCHRTWEQSSRRETNLRLWGWLIRNADFPRETQAWRIYRAAGSTSQPSPDKECYTIANGLSEAESDGREFGGSHLARVLSFISAHNRFAAFAGNPFDVPLGLASNLYMVEAEVAGHCFIENSREAQVKIEMAEHRAAIAQEAACQH